MSFKAKITGLYNSATGFVIRLIIAVLVAAAIWFISAFAIDYLLNFLATGDYNGIREVKYSSDQPMFMWIRGAICAIVFILLAKGKKR